MNDPLNDLFPTEEFEPTLAAALARLAAVRPGDYARTRNQIEGAVSRLSPYITHGFLSLPQVLVGLRQKHRLDAEHKFVYELGWREFFAHVWQERGDDIFQSLHEGLLPDAAYARELPADIRQGATGVPAIDEAVRALYATGYLHNHARMWLASYVVHFRKVHWRAGADWLYGHLLDGDLASNHLSWQWVAATGSHKAYLFNAENVARYAPKAWHSAGSVVDNSYEALDRMARDAGAVHKPHPRAARVEEPALYTQPPPGLNLPAATATSLPTNAWLVHPWALRDISDVREAPSGMTLVGAFVPAFHAQWPWSAKRWQFVAARMADVCKNSFWFEGSVPPSARFLHDLHLQPHGAHWPITQSIAAPRLFAEPASACTSFTQFYKRVSGSLQF